MNYPRFADMRMEHDAMDRFEGSKLGFHFENVSLQAGGQIAQTRALAFGEQALNQLNVDGRSCRIRHRQTAGSSPPMNMRLPRLLLKA